MKISKKEAIRRHRLMWNWIADETLRRNKLVEKEEAFEHFGWKKNGVKNLCWCCAYKYSNAKRFCGKTCIIKWAHNEGCADHIYSEFLMWCLERDPEKSAAIARKIANLPERKDV